MKETFKKAMRRLYPEGVEPHQLRDLVHCYAMGYADALVRANDKILLRVWAFNTQALAEPNWMPDDSWKWW